jgi:hypothetical protein
LKEELNAAVTNRLNGVEHEKFVDRAMKGQEAGYEGLNEKK